MKKVSISLLALAAALAIAPAAKATSIPVANGDFSQGVTLPLTYGCDGAVCSYSVGAIPDWNNSGVSGLFAPSSVYFFAYDGTTPIAYSNGPTISQTVTATVVAGDIYTLTVDIGSRLDNYWDDPGANLLVGDSYYYATGTQPAMGYFSAYTASFVGTAANARDSITIDLTTAGAQGDFSDVTLTENPVPEPSSLLLLGTGLAAFAGMLRRKLRA